jgi:DNA-binding SARP family transcriptional activator/tetratricopeptide (TPR) repeat protein
MEYRVLGPVAVAAGAGEVVLGGVRQRSVIAMLVLAGGAPVSVDALVNGVWGEQQPANPARSLQVYVSNLRRAARTASRSSSTNPIASTGRAYALDDPDAEIDVRRFEELIRAGRAAATGGEPVVASRLLADALDLWRGAALVDVADQPFAGPAVARLEGLRLSALEDRIAVDLELGRHGAVIVELEALIDEHRYRERLHALLMQALYRNGRQADALGVYQALRRNLIEAFGIEPGAELVELERLVLIQDSSLDLRPAHKLDTSLGPSSEPRPIGSGAVRTSAPITQPLPPLISRAVGLASLVGRREELAALETTWSESRHGSRQAAIVVGEAGVGKSRLVAELAVRAQASGGRVLLGRCDEAVPVALGPIVDLTRSALRLADGEELAALPDASRDYVNGLASAIPSARDGELMAEERNRHEAIDALLSTMAHRAPILVVLEDLHWADPASIRAVRHILLEPAPTPMLIVATSRSASGDSGHDVSSLLADLARFSAPVTTMKLGGLPSDLTSAFVEAHTGRPTTVELARELHSETEGNPFFLAELVRHLVDRDAVVPDDDDRWHSSGPLAALGLPDTVRATVRQRLVGLGAESNDLLVAAAVVGRQFELDLATRAAGLDDVRGLEALEAPVRSGLVKEGDDVGTYAFSHSLVRSAVISELVGVQRAVLHRRVGEAIEALRASRLTEYAEALALHFAHAVPAGEHERAVRYATLASAVAEGRGDVEAAERHLCGALALVDAWPQPDLDQSIEVVARLAFLRSTTGRHDEALELVDRAIDLATASRVPDHIAEAAAPLMNLFGWADPGTLPARIDRLLSIVDQTDDRSRAVASWIHSYSLSYFGTSRAEDDDAKRAARQAVRLTTSLDDQAQQYYALNALHQVLWARADVEEALDAARRMLEVRRPRQQALRSTYMIWYRIIVSSLQRGDRVATEESFRRFRTAPGGTSVPFALAFGSHHLAAMSLAEGRWHDADRHMAAARDSMPGNANFELGYWAQRLASRWERDEIDVDELDAMSALAPFPWLEVLGALVRAERGDRAGAVRRLDDFAARPDIGVPFNFGQAPVLAALAEAAAGVDHPTMARELRDLLEPYHGQMLVGFTGTLLLGSADRALGQVALLAHRHHEAVDLLADALTAEERFRAPALACRTRVWLACALVRRGGPGDADLASAQADRARRDAVRLGLAAVERRARRLLADTS